MPPVEEWMDLLEILTGITMLEQELWRILLFTGVLLAALIGGRVARWILERAAQRQADGGKEILSVFTGAVARSATLLAFAFALTPAFATLYLAEEAVRTFAHTVTGLVVTVAVGYALFQLVEVPDRWIQSIGRNSKSKMNAMIAPIISKTLRAVVILLTLVQIATVLSNKPLTSIIAGLGIGGLAIGLAAQDTIKNFFGSLSILADKPFELGDRVNIGGIDGMVESVGLRSTRIRTLTGHLVTIPNGDLANRTIENVAKRPFLRRSMNITVTYDTPPEKLEEAVRILKDLLRDHPGQNPERPPRVYFNEFNDTSLNLSVSFWYFPADWWPFNDYCEQLNFEIFRRFNDAGIDFAFPTQTVHLAGDPKRPLEIGVQSLPPGERA